MRVGSLAHNILMRGSLRIDLLLMCIGGCGHVACEI